jgi:DNA-binding NtrC family response regulator
MEGKTKILVIEDDIVTQSLYRHILEGQGYEVFAGSSIVEAVAITHRQKPHIAILDIILDETQKYGYNGIDAGVIVSKLAPGTKLIFISSQDEMLSWLDGFDVPYVARRLKPVGAKELLEMVSLAMKKIQDYG